MSGWELCLAQGTSPRCWSQLILLLSHLTLSIPQGEGCNHTAQAGLEGQDAPGERGESQQGGSQAEEGRMVSCLEGEMRCAGPGLLELRVAL